jgi:uncharacterized OB-fold protein
MNEIQCRHCGHRYAAQHTACPHCHTPTESQQQRLAAGAKKRFLYAFVGLIIFAALMILILPRDS